MSYELGAGNWKKQSKRISKAEPRRGRLGAPGFRWALDQLPAAWLPLAVAPCHSALARGGA
jgi:hypothetical protein